MEGIKQAAVCICVCCILCGTLSMLTPSTSFEKLIKLAIAAFLVCSAAVPLRETVIGLGAPEITVEVMETNERMEEAVTVFSSRMLENMVSGQIESALLSENVEAEDIRIYMDILKDGSISISQAEVILSVEDYGRWQSLADTVYVRTGVKAEFITEEE